MLKTINIMQRRNTNAYGTAYTHRSLYARGAYAVVTFTYSAQVNSVTLNLFSAGE